MPNTKNEEREKEKTKLEEIILQDSQYNEGSREYFEKIMEQHIGYTEEKNYFITNIDLYLNKNPDIRLHRKVICLAGPPGTGKTTFVQTLANAMKRELYLVSCAGLKLSDEFSLLGDEEKKSIVARAILKTEKKNPIILFDELEKAEDLEVQRQLISLFEKFERGEIFTDDYYSDTRFDLKEISFLVAVNFLEDLAPSLRNKIELKELKGYKNEEKRRILKLKAEAFVKKYDLEKERKEIFDKAIEFLVKERIQEKGVRKLELVLRRVFIEYIYQKTESKEKKLVLRK